VTLRTVAALGAGDDAARLDGVVTLGVRDDRVAWSMVSTPPA
jgi:hypothetical protein